MPKWTTSPIYEVIIDGEKRELGPTITEKNISRYKQQDLHRILLDGGTLASDEEYIEAEVKLQELYRKIMGEE